MARRTAWEDELIDFNVSDAGQSSTQLMSTITADESRGTTLTRLIYELAVFSTTVAGAWGTQFLDLGIAVLDEDAFVAGALPDPNVEGAEPPRGWVWRTRCVVAQNGTGTPIILRCVGDLRAQRKMDGGVLVLIANSTGGPPKPFS